MSCRHSAVSRLEQLQLGRLPEGCAERTPSMPTTSAVVWGLLLDLAVYHKAPSLLSL